MDRRRFVALAPAAAAFFPGSGYAQEVDLDSCSYVASAFTVVQMIVGGMSEFADDAVPFRDRVFTLAGTIAVARIGRQVLDQQDPPSTFDQTHDLLIEALEAFAAAETDIQRALFDSDAEALTRATDSMEEATELFELALAGFEGSLTGFAEGLSQTETPSVSSSPAPVISGVGTMVSEPFHLSPGRYRVGATVEATDFTGFICDLHAPDGSSSTLFNELIESPQAWTGAVVHSIGAGGEFFVAVSNTDSAWSVAFEPM